MDFIKNKVIPLIDPQVMDFIINKALPIFIPIFITAVANYTVPRIFNFLKWIINDIAINSVLAPMLHKSGYLFRAGANMRDLKETADKLKQAKESAGAMSGEQVNVWMTKVQAMEALLGKIEEDYDNMYAIDFWTRYGVAKQAAEAVLKMKELISEQQGFGVLVNTSTTATIRKEFNLPNYMPSSTKKCLSTACQYLQDDSVGMVGIWGMGGVGKTTFLQRINNHLSLPAAGFDCVIWVVVSQEFNLDKLQKDIAERVGLALEATSTVDSQADALRHYLKTKKFLLLLDDLWKPFELAKLGIPRPSDVRKSKVVFTTRSWTVCDQMMAVLNSEFGCSWKIELECLQHEEAWKLFLDSVGKGMSSIIYSDEKVRSRAQQIADKCGGLPHALVVIAQTMSANKTWQEWEHAIISINKNGIQGKWRKDGTGLFPRLRISYDRLPDETIKNCFLCCALWPESYNIMESYLINCWLGMNLIDGHGDYAERYMHGYSIVQILKRECLLQEAEEDEYERAYLRMHVVIRSMALWIASDCKKRWMIVDQAKLKKETEDATERKEAEVIFLTHQQSEALPQHLDCPNLLSLRLRGTRIGMVPEGFFQNMHALTFLDLSKTAITELPQAICGLLRLRHLDLSANPLCSLPIELGSLSELTGLHLDHSKHLETIPRGLIPRLQKLELLMLDSTAFDGWGTEGQATIEELVSSKITSLGLDIRRLETLEQLSNKPSMSLWAINMRDLSRVIMLPLQALLQAGNTRCTLHKLRIQDCDSLEEISASSQCDEGLDNLDRLDLKNLPALEKISFAGAVPRSLLWSIRYLTIRSCEKLRNVAWILHLPNLEALTIKRCPEMVHLIDVEQGSGESRGTNEQENLMVFDKLNRVWLEDLPKLCSVSTHAIAFPSMKHWYVQGCPEFNEDSLRKAIEKGRR